MYAEHLDNRIKGDDFESVPNRNGYGEGLKEAGDRDERIVALTADLTESTRTHLFAEEFPDRFIQVGVAEQNLASVASGMAAMGKIPFVASYAMFSPGRNWEQIRTTITYNNTNVKIVGAHAGVSVGPDGATHQAIEDIAIMRVLPNMTVLAPCDVHEARKAVLAAAKHEGPVYIRLARAASAVVTTPHSPFVLGKSELFYTKDESKKQSVGIVTTGSLAYQALQAATKLETDYNIGASVLHMPTIKPLDTEALDKLANGHDILCTVEEHQRIGGLGSAVCEHISEKNPITVIRVGINDSFGQSGEPEELLKHYGLDAEAIANKVKAYFQ